MNNNFIKSFIFVFGVTFVVPVFAATVTDRSDCDTIQARINELSAIDVLDETQNAELTKLQSQYRSNCSKSASGRRTTGRVSSATASATTTQNTTPVVETTVVTVQSVLKDYISKREALCEELKENINLLTDNVAQESDVKGLQNQYDKDCSDIDKSEVVDIDAETAAANVAAGLCTDGTKPNQYGCCKGETFKDMGNLVFACCPDDGGDCYPPINTGNTI